MTTHPIDTEALRLLADAATPGPWHYIPGDHDLASAGIDITAEGDSLTWDDHSGEVFTHPDAEFIAAAREAVPALLDRIARLEAQSDIRGRAVVMYRERAREAEARIKAVQDAADIWDEGWEQGVAFVTGMERGAGDDDLDHAATNPYRAAETA